MGTEVLMLFVILSMVGIITFIHILTTDIKYTPADHIGDWEIKSNPRHKTHELVEEFNETKWDFNDYKGGK